MVAATTDVPALLLAGHPADGLTLGLPVPTTGPPRLRAPSISRVELLERLERERDRPLVVLSAPAGYGKTTLLRQWAHAQDRPVAWVSLDAHTTTAAILKDSIDGALECCGIELESTPRFALVLDDAHHVPPELLGAAVLGVLRWLPDGCQLAVASRSQGLVGLSRWRAERMVVEVHAEELSMSVTEATALLGRAGIGLDPAAIDTLMERTQGWPVALALSAGSWRGRGQPPGNWRLPRGDDQVFSEYFRDEFLAQLPPATGRFLVHASVLDLLSGPACDAVLGRRRSGRVLAELSRANVPVSSVGPGDEYYRLHGLFREALQAELRRSEPELEADLHRRACEYHRRAGDVDRAVDHARRAHDLNLVGEMLWSELPSYLGRGRLQALQGWLSDVTPESAARSAQLALVAAHSSLASGDLAVAEQWARVAGVALDAWPEGCADRERAAVLIIESWAARSGVRGMMQASARASELLPDDSPWRAGCCLLAGTAALLAGDRGRAQRLLEEGAARGVIMASHDASLCLAQLAVLAQDRGDLETASDCVARARRMVDEHGLEAYPAAALVCIVEAADSLGGGRVDEAKAATAQGLARLARLDDALGWYGAEVRILAARVLLALGDVARARQLLADASRLGRRTPGAVIFQEWFGAAWDQFDARAETALAGAATLTTAELRVLRFLPTHYAFHEIAARLHVSSNTVKTHVHAVYRKLDASSRSEAVARASAAGLLGG